MAPACPTFSTSLSPSLVFLPTRSVGGTKFWGLFFIHTLFLGDPAITHQTKVLISCFPPSKFIPTQSSPISTNDTSQLSLTEVNILEVILDSFFFCFASHIHSSLSPVKSIFKKKPKCNQLIFPCKHSALCYYSPSWPSKVVSKLPLWAQSILHTRDCFPRVKISITPQVTTVQGLPTLQPELKPNFYSQLSKAL